MAEKQAIKLPDEELNPVRELRQKYNNLMIQLGQAELQKHDLKNALNEVQAVSDKLKEEYEATKANERQQLDVLNKKYGVGVLNVESGLFTPNPPVEPDVQPPLEPSPTPPKK